MQETYMIDKRFLEYCRTLTNSQVQAVLEKERSAAAFEQAHLQDQSLWDRSACYEAAKVEMQRRGLM